MTSVSSSPFQSVNWNDLISVEDFTRRSRPKQTRRDQRLARLQERYMEREITAGVYLDAVEDIYTKLWHNRCRML